MNNYRAILKRVGVVLLAFGSMGTAEMLYSLFQNPSDSLKWSLYASLYAVVASIRLLRGNLRAVPDITWVAALIASFLGSQFIVFLVFKPIELWAIEFRLYPVQMTLDVLFEIVTVVIFLWVCRELRSTSVVSAIVQAGHWAYKPTFGFIIGVTLVAFLSGIFYWSVNGEAGRKAVQIAQAKYGESYKYYVTGIGWEGSQRSASLIAYNEQEMKPVQLKWPQ